MKLTGNMQGVAAMLIGVAFFAAMDSAIKLLATSFAPLQIAAMRSLGSLPLILAYVRLRGGRPGLASPRWPLQLLRGLLGVLSLWGFAYGLKHLALAEAYSIFFAAPLMIVVLSVAILKESVSADRWLAVGLGLLGVLLALRPTGAGMISLGGLAILLSAACYALAVVLVPMLARTESTESMMLWMIVVGALVSTGLAAPEWVPIQRADLLLVVAMVAPGFLGQVALTEAFRRGAASIVAPFEYSALGWGVGVDLLLWGVLPGAWTMVGAMVVCGAGVYLVRHEQRQAAATLLETDVESARGRSCHT